MGKRLRCWGNIFYAFCLLFVWSGKKKIQSCPWSPFAKQATHAWHVRNNTTSEQTNSFGRWMLLEILLDVVQLKQQKWQILSKLQILQILVTWTALGLILQRDTTDNITTCFCWLRQGRPQRKRHFIGHILENLVRPWRMHPHQRWEIGGNERLGCYHDLGTVL